jgi:hypothetical protein
MFTSPQPGHKDNEISLDSNTVQNVKRHYNAFSLLELLSHFTQHTYFGSILTASDIWWSRLG